ncbi:MAG TPA: ACP phosphodiesterase [Chitinophagaceae bacterium]
MNYLGHAYLSYNVPQILVGNMISDFVKGSARFGYTANIQSGITLHRDIDNYTDMHPATREAKEFFRKEYRLYSAPLVDVIYDHFLAADTNTFPGDSLHPFSLSVYDTLEQNAIHLPPRFSFMLTYMKHENWLYNYKTLQGINKSLRGLVHRSTYMVDHQPAFSILQENYSVLQELYTLFIADVKSFAKNRLEQLMP